MAANNAAGSSSGYIGIEYTNDGKIILRAGHQYFLKKRYKNGSEIWECSNRRRQKCTGSVVVRKNELLKEIPHQCQPDFERNEVIRFMQNIKNEVKSTEVPSITATCSTEASPIRTDMGSATLVLY